MRIAVIHPSFAVFGGTERLIQDLYPALVERGHDVTLFTADVRAEVRERLTGVTVRDIGPVHFYEDRRLLGEQVRVGRMLAPMLSDFDVVRTHGIPAPSWWLAACNADASLRGTISNWCCHGIMGGPYDAYAAPHVLAAREAAPRELTPALRERMQARVEQMSRRGVDGTLIAAWSRLTGQTGTFVTDVMKDHASAARNVTRIVTDSAFVAGYLHDLWGVDPVVCHPGLAITNQTPIAPPGDELLTICRLQESKNVAGVLRAVARLRERGPLPFSRYVIVGDGADRHRLERTSKDLDLGDVVRFEGSVPNEHLDQYLDRAGLFILPALDESFGVTYLETGARGRAAIGPSHGGPAEILVDGETGWIVDPTDVEGLASAIAGAFADRDELRRRGLAARTRVETHFSTQRFAQCTERACSAEPSD